jgi:hypothetical protein
MMQTFLLKCGVPEAPRCDLCVVLPSIVVWCVEGWVMQQWLFPAVGSAVMFEVTVVPE